MLHFWMGPSGPPTWPSGPLSGVLSCATLPFAWIAGRRLGGRTVAVGAVLLLATSPFAVRYATENRMYTLVAFLTAAGLVALQRALERPAPGNLVALALTSSLLLYSQYSSHCVSYVKRVSHTPSFVWVRLFLDRHIIPFFQFVL